MGRYVNQSSLNGVIDEIEARREEFDKLGHVERRAMVARKPFVVRRVLLLPQIPSIPNPPSRLTQKDYDQFASIDTSIVWTQFPQDIDVLTLHGLKDEVVPPYDAFIYSRAYGSRTPGSHILRYVEDADHNFTGVCIFP